jgi:hypothetical protein
VIRIPEVIMPGRKVRDELEARRFLDAVARSGLERATWAHQHGIDARSLNAWRLVLARKEREDEAPLRLVELVPPSRPTPRADPIRVVLDDLVIEVSADMDEAALIRVLRAARAC